MLGWINLSIESFITDTFGADKWQSILAASGVHKNWVSSCPYSDKITYDLVVTAAGQLGVSVNDALEAYGAYFVKHVADNGYTKLLHVLGSNIAEFLQNLNNLHLHLSMGWPSMVAPAFRCEQVTPESLLLHYHSSRPGLWPIVTGVLKGMSKEYFGFEVGVELVESRDAGADHEVFRLTYPRQEALRGWGDEAAAADDAAAAGALYGMPPSLFYRLHPFHALLAADEDLTLLQLGPGLRRIAPACRPGEPFVRHFKVRHPYVPATYRDFALNANTSFLVLVREAMVTLKGQVVPVTLPPGAGPAGGEGGGTERKALLLLASPRCSNLQDMQAQRLFLSDIPLHDMSRDFILLAEQRQAEADLKEQFERTAAELRSANEKLARTTRWLEEEKARSDALLYRMGALISCFPGPGDNGPAAQQQQQQQQQQASSLERGNSGTTSAAAGPISGSLPATSGSHVSEDGSLAPGGSMAAVAALLRQAGVRAPSMIGESTAAIRDGATMTLGEMGSMAGGAGGGDRRLNAIDRIEAVRRELANANFGATGEEEDTIACCELLGEGTYGKVYKGLWKGSVVAVKTIVLPALMSGSERREKMAIMEAAISSALSHPNVVQTYTYDIRPLRDTSSAASRVVMGTGALTEAGGGMASQGPGSGVHSFEVRLVLEFCDKGSLRDALDRGAFRLPPGGGSDGGGSAGGGSAGGNADGAASASASASDAAAAAAGVNYRAVLDTAIDIATAMAHLHGRNVLHSDLKARNIMLKTSGAEGRGVTAKVADFGLSVKMDLADTHLSHSFQGTMSHMAPELLVKGHLSKASDVYAFGIMLWELATGGHPFRSVPRALLGHAITKLHKRPEFDGSVPPAYAALASRCWDTKPSRRPTFDEVLAELKYLRRDEPPSTPPLTHFEPPAPQPIDATGATLPAGAAGAAGARQAAEDRSFYVDHSASTMHDDDTDSDGGVPSGSSSDDGGGGDGDGSSSDGGGGAGGGGGGSGAAAAARCPFAHRV